MICKEGKKYFATLFSEMDSSTMWKVLIGYGFPSSNNFRCSFNVSEIIDYLDNVVHIEEPDITNFVSGCMLTHSYLAERFLFVDINGVYSEILHIFSGVLEDFVLALLLFIMYFNGLQVILTPMYQQLNRVFKRELCFVDFKS
uniref:Uncharacterized protein n=1 Tax=Glossina pallidipes TaxID=7398 RepID=A0A1B0AEE1_GLOPL